MKHLSGSPLEGRLLALPTKIRLRWKGLPGINILAYYGNMQITAVISFVIQAPGLTHKHKTRLEKLARDKLFSLL
jgi:hypothetical protein